MLCLTHSKMHRLRFFFFLFLPRLPVPNIVVTTATNVYILDGDSVFIHAGIHNNGLMYCNIGKEFGSKPLACFIIVANQYKSYKSHSIHT